MSQFQCGGLMGRIPILVRRTYRHNSMRNRGYTGYYSRFREAIPGTRASWIRVTHPCAGRRQRKQASAALPLDLHVLSL